MIAMPQAPRRKGNTFAAANNRASERAGDAGAGSVLVTASCPGAKQRERSDRCVADPGPSFVLTGAPDQ
jgi:hypothetical protein